MGVLDTIQSIISLLIHLEGRHKSVCVRCTDVVTDGSRHLCQNVIQVIVIRLHRGSFVLLILNVIAVIHIVPP